MKIVLLGYMASGKSTIGKALAEKRGLPFFDLDTEIEKASGMSIPELFEKKGEIYFRRKESEVLRDVIGSKSAFVLSLGGGTPCYGTNMEAILAPDVASFYLKLPISELVDRIHNEKDSRPLVASLAAEELPEFVGKHLFERSPYYNRAGKIIACSGKSVSETVAEIEATLI
ncbi:shikimate kinase [Flagellimonas sp. DF-77]|uniref:shikimate kinase n=1 Tax=Flagellimonas algarum TaxID=3230298 RepID=UPI0033946241